MQGIFINGKRPTSKNAVAEAVKADPASVVAEATSFFGGEYDGPVSGLTPGGKSIAFVGPDPFRDRRFYGTIARRPDGVIIVK